MILYISYKKNAVKKRRLPAIYAEKRDLSSAESRFAYEQTAFHFGAFAVKQSSGGRRVCVTDGRAPAFLRGNTGGTAEFLSVPFRDGFFICGIFYIFENKNIGGTQNEKTA